MQNCVLNFCRNYIIFLLCYLYFCLTRVISFDPSFKLSTSAGAFIYGESDDDSVAQVIDTKFLRLIDKRFEMIEPSKLSLIQLNVHCTQKSN